MTVFVSAALALTGMVGCQADFREYKHPWFLDRQDAAYYLSQAKENPSADVRRRSIERLAQTAFVTDDDALATLSSVARNDASQSVRVAAMQAMGRNTNRTTALTAIDILIPPDEADTSGPSPPDADVRAAAMRVLAQCAADGALDTKLSDAAVTVGVKRLTSDESRNVRLLAAELLGYFPRQDVLSALVSAMEQRDFGVCDAAWKSLVRLTGQSIGHDARVWHDFMSETDDPFARREGSDDQSSENARQWWAFKWFQKQ